MAAFVQGGEYIYGSVLYGCIGFDTNLQAVLAAIVPVGVPQLVIPNDDALWARVVISVNPRLPDGAAVRDTSGRAYIMRATYDLVAPLSGSIAIVELADALYEVVLLNADKLTQITT